jgi:endonuclease YncB( thermonuclease family)
MCLCISTKCIGYNQSVLDTDILDAEYKTTDPFIIPITRGKVIKVYDGDTITIAAKLPYKESPVYKFQVRLLGIDTPEIKGHCEKEKDLAVIARDALHDKIFGKIVELKNVSNEKYGRILADIYLDTLHINKWLLDAKYAVPYNGGTKTEWFNLHT